jgi:Cu+-exporting ATPase
MSLLSGDNNQQQNAMEELLGVESKLLFKQSPSQKLQYIQHLQNLDNKVLMMGDGLNDAGALQQSNVGITLADDINNFTPSCDAILNADQLSRLPGMLQLSQKARIVIAVSFVVSILYNIVGLYFAMQGLMKPMVAAILMPCSTLSIVLITGGLSSFFAKKYKLSL